MDSLPRNKLPARRVLGVAMVLAILAAVSGCGHDQREESSIEPIPSSRDINNPELGPPEVRPLSYGPGEKDSPSWGPSGERIAFVIDGYVAEKPLGSEDFQRRTTRDLSAEQVSWPPSGEEVAILGEGAPSEMARDSSEGETHPLYVTRSEEGQLKIERLADNALALSLDSGDAPLAAALESGAYESRVALVEPGEGLSVYPDPVPGRVGEISVSPGGERALASVLIPSGGERYEIHAIDLSSGESERLARMPEGVEVFGAPQQTDNGVYYVGGKREESSGPEEDTRYSLYRIPEGSGEPEQASGVGRDFIASAIKVSPDGGRLALLGRRDSGSSTNLYILDLSEGRLSSATVNENMDIRTDADSLDFSNDGESVAIVARSDISGPRVYNGSSDTLLANFYNIYEVPVSESHLREEN